MGARVDITEDAQGVGRKGVESAGKGAVDAIVGRGKRRAQKGADGTDRGE